MLFYLGNNNFFSKSIKTTEESHLLRFRNLAADTVNRGWNYLSSSSAQFKTLIIDIKSNILSKSASINIFTTLTPTKQNQSLHSSLRKSSITVNSLSGDESKTDTSVYMKNSRMFHSQNATAAGSDDETMMQNKTDGPSRRVSYSLPTTSILLIAIVVPFGLAIMVIGGFFCTFYCQENGKKFKSILPMG